MVNTILARQESLRLSVPDHIAVAGCGGTGAWVAIMAALVGVRQITLYDPDTVAEHNLNRLPFPPSSVGRTKVAVLAEILTTLRPECEVTAVAEACTAIDVGRASLLLDCTDRSDAQTMLCAESNRRAIPYIRIGCDANRIGVVKSIPDWGEDNTGYEVIPMWVGPAVLAAVVGLGVAVDRWKETNVSLLDLVGRPDPAVWYANDDEDEDGDDDESEEEDE